MPGPLESMSSSSTLSSTLSSSSSAASYPSSPCSAPRSSTSSLLTSEPKSSLTPQRKHRKMLKDGTSEVWPEEIEEIFVQGLRAYWQSPWATFSRGRSRWRNQFLVDYLHNAGIERTKKQVASHIQVLRNMWKGEKEYQLVAGGDELFENGMVAQTRFKHVSPESVTPSPPIQVKEEPMDLDKAPLFPVSPRQGSVKIEPISPSEHDATLPPFYATTSLPPLSPTDSIMSSPDSFTSSDRHFPPQEHVRGRSVSNLPTTARPTFAQNCRLTSLSLWAEGMQPVTLDVAHLSTNSPPGARVVLRVSLFASLLSDVMSPPTMHGFQGTATFSGRWHRAATCVTRVIVNGVCDSEEKGAFDVLPPSANGIPVPTAGANTPAVTALLPDSWLSRCRWRNAGLPTRLTQTIFVDGDEIASIYYELNRPPSGNASAVLAAATTEPARPRPASTERASPAYTWEPRNRPYNVARSHTVSLSGRHPALSVGGCLPRGGPTSSALFP